MTSHVCFTKSTTQSTPLLFLLRRNAEFINETNMNNLYIETIQNGVIYWWKSNEARLQSMKTIPEEVQTTIKTIHTKIGYKQHFYKYIEEHVHEITKKDRFKVEIDDPRFLLEYYEKLVKHVQSIHKDIFVTLKNGGYIEFGFKSKESLIVYSNLWFLRTSQPKKPKLISSY